MSGGEQTNRPFRVHIVAGCNGEHDRIGLVVDGELRCGPGEMVLRGRLLEPLEPERLALLVKAGQGALVATGSDPRVNEIRIWRVDLAQAFAVPGQLNAVGLSDLEGNFGGSPEAPLGYIYAAREFTGRSFPGSIGGPSKPAPPSPDVERRAKDAVLAIVYGVYVEGGLLRSAIECLGDGGRELLMARWQRAVAEAFRGGEAEALLDAVARIDASLRADGAGGARIEGGEIMVWGGPPGLHPASPVEATNVTVARVRQEHVEGGPRWTRFQHVEYLERWVRDPERYRGLGGESAEKP